MNDIKNLIEKISAGRASLDDNTGNKLFKDIVDEIEKTAELFGKKPDETVISNWNDLLLRINSSRFGREIAARLDPAKFYKLGQMLSLALSENSIISKALIPIVHEYLDLFRQPEFLIKIYNQRIWDELILDLIRKSNYNFKVLFTQRVRDYSSKPLLGLIKNNNIKMYSWDEVSDIVSHYLKAIYSALSEDLDNEINVAFLLENSLNMACLDFACLSGGVVNVMIPSNSVEQHIEFILNETKVPLLFVSDEKQLTKIKSIKNKLTYLRKVILVEGISAESWVITFENFLGSAAANTIKKDIFEKNLHSDKLATIMYTSGTTGEPKGIMFSHTNIIYKRFCRAMAIPGIGDKDRFLSYLPLFHTFGRYLELMGSVFWGAEYYFMENPSLNAILSNMQQVKPTVFISIPKKWIQLYEYIASQVDIELEDVRLIKDTVKSATGNELKWGLSAAGFLPPEIFQFFQNNGVELMSGFGMTEATGGITMTPPEKYKSNSLGKALPGIEIKTAEDGELLIRGNYVMLNYFGQNKDEVFDSEGWLPTGDVMRMDENNFIEIIDRKKEIYKNVKGETIAPQKIENYFRDFESIKQVFLVGDHRPFNTLLIYPNYDIPELSFLTLSDGEKNEYFSSLIVTVNNFLAPFERIVDFRLVNRAFSEDHGELTPKGTYKRRMIEKNFDDVIEPMYERNFTELLVGTFKLRIPNWFLREKGCLSADIIYENYKIIIPKTGSGLFIKKVDDEFVKIGNYRYRHLSNTIELQWLLIDPELWIGNNQLVDFAGNSIIQWQQIINRNPGFSFSSIIDKYLPDNFDGNYFKQITESGENSVYGLHLAVLAIQTDEYFNLGLSYIENCLTEVDSIVSKYSFEILMRPDYGKSKSSRRLMLKTAVQHSSPHSLATFLRKYIDYDWDIIDDEIIDVTSKQGKKPDKMNTLISLLRAKIKELEIDEKIDETCIPSIFKMVCQYGIKHPSTYEKIRQVFVEYQLQKSKPKLSLLALETRNILRNGFRAWFGENKSVAVDMETNEEYGWEDVIIFEDGISKDDKEKIQKCIVETVLLSEAIFLISKGKVIQLNDLLPGGIWISELRRFHNKTNYRVSVQTRLYGSFELVFTINFCRQKDDINNEVSLLILAGSRQYLQELVEDFGGYWEKYDLWSSKYIPGDSAEKFLAREYRKIEDFNNNRLYFIWPYFVWNAAAAYFNFWRLTDYKEILSDPSLDNFIIPSHDYQTGTKVISLSQKSPFISLTDLFRNFYSLFIEAGENKYPFLHRKKIWTFAFAGLINAEGEELGIKILKDFKNELMKKNVFENELEIEHQLDEFIKTVSEGNYVPKLLYFAIKRFQRWKQLNNDADQTAQAQMLNELYETYRLSELTQAYPEARAKLYFETVFSNSSDELKVVLKEIIEQYHKHIITEEEELSMLSNLSSQFNLSESEKFFLTRLIYPYLKPSDSAHLIEYKVDGKASSNLVVEYEDSDGMQYYIRKPISPKEISRLHQIFIEANLLVTFRPEHEYLLAISERGFIIGGLYYLRQSDGSAYMEKIVVSNRYRRKGISDRLMNEFFERMHNDRIKFVTTGFFRPEYFYKFGFSVEKKYSGLVKELK
ncbi:MAG: hypothetical protein CVV23_08645 [Ignavibacteriae bacterium HGW-Ignavibacteriae-2]|jgi:long-subunit acyl-CoA synthetase (AMP-forming)|nr:MAG: hypothetical protein CVV23_08645 [Ignavibacteriae bacterium HGW-Ignavibacteriae-2]